METSLCPFSVVVAYLWLTSRHGDHISGDFPLATISERRLMRAYSTLLCQNSMGALSRHEDFFRNPQAGEGGYRSDDNQ
jgi:hypothetical protein